MDIGIISVLASVDGRFAVFYTGGQASGCGGESVSCCYCDVVPFRDILLILEIRWSSVWEILFWRKVQY